MAPVDCSQSMQSVHSGFLQVRENWKRSGNLGGQGKSGKMLKIWHSQGKVRENENCIQKTHQNSSFHHVKLENFLGGDTPEPPLGSWGCILTFTVISGPLLCKFLASPLHHWWVVVTNSCLSVKGINMYWFTVWGVWSLNIKRIKSAISQIHNVIALLVYWLHRGIFSPTFVHFIDHCHHSFSAYMWSDINC